MLNNTDWHMTLQEAMHGRSGGFHMIFDADMRRDLLFLNEKEKCLLG